MSALLGDCPSSQTKKLLLQRRLLVVVLLLLIILLAYPRLTFLATYQEWEGMLTALEQLSSELEQNSTLFVFNAPRAVSADLFAFPLRYLYGFNTVSIRALDLQGRHSEVIAERVGRLVESNRSVYLLHPPDVLLDSLEQYYLRETEHTLPYIHLTANYTQLIAKTDTLYEDYKRQYRLPVYEVLNKPRTKENCSSINC